MVEENHDNDKDTSSTALPAKKFSRGIILGKDGKPCRTCNSLSEFTSATKKPSKGGVAAIAASSLPADCPPDVEQLGRSSWTLLHSIAGTYPERPTAEEQGNVRQFVVLFSKLYPCWVCAEDFQTFMVRHRVRTESRDEFGQWMCEAHNEVNRKLGKPVFDCATWEERWRTGWKNGSCD